MRRLLLFASIVVLAYVEIVMLKRQPEITPANSLPGVSELPTSLLVVMLARTPKRRARFSELQRMIEGISQRMLTTTLRNLERDGFVTREVFAEVPPRVARRRSGQTDGHARERLAP